LDKITIFLLAVIFAFSGCSSSRTSANTTPNPTYIPGSTPTEGLRADAPFYELVDLPQEARDKVIKVHGEDTRWAIVTYSLKEYRGKLITIELQADVKRTGARGNLNWQVNNAPGYPGISYKEDAATDVWHRMRGRLIVTPSENDPYVYLTNWENKARDTVYYIDNFSITITEGAALTPDLTLTPLKTIYDNYFLIGNIIDGNVFSASEEYFKLLTRHYNIITSAATYPVMLAPSVKGGAYQWEIADQLIDLVRSHNLPIHGHVLAWHEASPAWLTSGTRDEVKANLEQYITAVLTHFKGKMVSWDVVNEAFRDNLSSADAAGDWKKCVRNSHGASVTTPWYDILGPDYIELAFRAARAADPGVTLYYNDYGLNNQNKAEAVRKMIDDINTRYKAEGNKRDLIEGVGMQGHYSLTLNTEEVRKSLEKFSSMGIEIAVSELDISTVGYDRGSGRDTPMSEKDAAAQAMLYARLFKLYKEYAKHIKRVTMWGMDDGTSWISAGNPCLFDWKLNAKKAFYAVSDPDSFLQQR
jgi:endo-1,4-beta-xylanase